LKTFIVRIYRYKKNKKPALVGTAEEVGRKAKQAFTNIDELWEILKSVKLKARKLKYGDERRNEIRIERKLPCVFNSQKHGLKATITNYSKHGMCIKIDKRIALLSKELFQLISDNFRIKVHAVWSESNSGPSRTMSGFKVVDGQLNLNDIKKSKNIVIKEISKIVH
jgi:hypothetical protein